MTNNQLPYLSTNDLSGLFSDDLQSGQKVPRVIVGQDASTLRQLALDTLGSSTSDISNDTALPALGGYSLTGKPAVIVLTVAEFYAGLLLAGEEFASNPNFKADSTILGVSRAHAAAIADRLRLLESSERAIVLMDLGEAPSNQHVGAALSMATEKTPVLSMPSRCSFNFIASNIGVVNVALRNRCQLFSVSDTPRSRLDASALDNGLSPSTGSSPRP